MAPLLLAVLSLQDPPVVAPVDFYGEIRPFLNIRCTMCHGGEKPKGGLRLDRRESILAGGESGEPAVVPGDAGRSLLIRLVTSNQADERMPAKGPPLTPQEVAKLRRWIDQGAKWPDQDDYWAFKPPRRPPVPEGNAANPIDRFLRLPPAPSADKIVLIRRLYADLIGVPPAIAGTDAFMNDASPDAYGNLVDRLLADPRFGERWARHWLDLVRYAESDGFENDKIRPHAWRYRDYVIRSFNEDKPYDRFILEQIAGDEIFPDDPDALVATGFARLSPWDELCKNESQRRQDYLNDATDTVGSVFLGFTMGCARCHDHKYDRITQADYYSLQAFFAGSSRDRRDLPGGGRDPADYRKRHADMQARIAALKGERRALLEKHRALAVLEKLMSGAGDEVQATDDEAKKQIEKDKDEKKRFDAVDVEVKTLEPEAEMYRPAVEAVGDSGAAPATRILLRGSMATPGAEVEPAFVAAMARGAAPAGKRRTALARWLASPDHPMTARVIVNRLWQHHFGQGLVATPSDFGRNGRRPTNPELLDWLAAELVANGWRLKPIHRLILTSDAWRRPGPPRRLEGEAIRDSILAVSGRLNPKAGGPGVYVPLSKEVLTDIPNNDKLPSWGACSEEDGRRRTIYVFQRRALMLPLVEAFDGADMGHPCPKRAVTTVAPQALALFNGEFVRGEAKHVAERVVREAGSDPAKQVRHAWRLALVRPATDAEVADGLRFLDDQAARRIQPVAGTGVVPAEARKEGERMALVDFCHVLLNTNEFVYVD
jgi:hypothetical protein